MELKRIVQVIFSIQMLSYLGCAEVQEFGLRGPRPVGTTSAAATFWSSGPRTLYCPVDYDINQDGDVFMRDAEVIADAIHLSRDAFRNRYANGTPNAEQLFLNVESLSCLVDGVATSLDSAIFNDHLNNGSIHKCPCGTSTNLPPHDSF